MQGGELGILDRVLGSAIKALHDLEQVRHLVLANTSLGTGGRYLAQRPDSLQLPRGMQLL